MIRGLCSEDPEWTKVITLWALKSRTIPNDSRSALWSPELKQMNRFLCSECPNWTNARIKWIALWSPELYQMIRALKSRTEPNESRSEVMNWTKWIELWSNELNQMNRTLCSEVPNWTKLITLCALKSRTESNESRSAFWSPDWT